MTQKRTPMLKQYDAVKKEYPDVIVMFRMGDFYEMFGEDAKIAAPIMQLTLTGRPTSEGRLPMCGVPYHAVERYLARLIAAGHRVAICDQMEDPKKAKGLVKRAVTRLVTPGTILEDGLLPSGGNNYLAAVAQGGMAVGLAFCDISTGEFAVTQISGQDATKRAEEEISRLSPAEVLFLEGDSSDLREYLENLKGALVTDLDREPFATIGPRERLLEHFQVASLRGYGCEEMPQAIEAADAIIRYLKRTQVSVIGYVTSLTTYETSGFMGLDASARRNLELTQALWQGNNSKSLIQIMNKTVTPMGGRLLKKWLEQPLLNVERIHRRQGAVRELYENVMLRGDLREVLQQIADLERLTSRAATGTASPRDLVALKNSLSVLPQVKTILDSAKGETLKDLGKEICTLDSVVDLIGIALVEDPPALLRDGGIIRPGYNAELDKLRNASHNGKEWIANIEQRERDRTGIKNLKIGYNAVFGYYIEVSKSNLSQVPEDYTRKQTTVAGERFITPELKEYEALVLGAEEKILSLEQELFFDVRQKVAAEAPEILHIAGVLAKLDTLCSLAEVSVQNGYCLPEVDESDLIEIRNGRHPVVEQSLNEDRFISNDTLLNCEENRLQIITGPNMAGKSTYLRQVALIVLLAQVGSYVPADSAHIGIVDRIFTRVGAHDDLSSGQSTFMVEMNETANILNNATKRSLVVLDEIGRGTSTFDGLSIAWAVSEYLQSMEAKTLFATHYHQLNDLEKQLEGVRNYRIAVKEDGQKIVWLRKIMPGGTDRSYGIQVARMAGLPKEVIHRAQEVLDELEKNDGARGIEDSKVSISAKSETVQLTLFDVKESPVIEELRKLDTSVLTPIEALTTLDRLQKMANGKKKIK